MSVVFYYSIKGKRAVEVSYGLYMDCMHFWLAICQYSQYLIVYFVPIPSYFELHAFNMQKIKEKLLWGQKLPHWPLKEGKTCRSF